MRHLAQSGARPARSVPGVHASVLPRLESLDRFCSANLMVDHPACRSAMSCSTFDSMNAMARNRDRASSCSKARQWEPGRRRRQFERRCRIYGYPAGLSGPQSAAVTPFLRMIARRADGRRPRVRHASHASGPVVVHVHQLVGRGTLLGHNIRVVMGIFVALCITQRRRPE